MGRRITITVLSIMCFASMLVAFAITGLDADLDVATRYQIEIARKNPACLSDFGITTGAWIGAFACNQASTAYTTATTTVRLSMEKVTP